MQLFNTQFAALFVYFVLQFVRTKAAWQPLCMLSSIKLFVLRGLGTLLLDVLLDFAIVALVALQTERRALESPQEATKRAKDTSDPHRGACYALVQLVAYAHKQSTVCLTLPCSQQSLL